MTDLRYAIRNLLRSPGFTIVAVVSLALSLGANVTIYTVANAFLTRPIPGASATDDLVRIYRGRHSPLQASELAFVRANNTAFTEVVGERLMAVALANGTATERMTAALVTDGYFPALGVRPAAGRLFTAQDTALQTVVISHALWQQRYGSDPGVVGKSIRVNGTSFTVVGVAPPAFASSMFLWRADLWFAPGAFAAIAGAPMEQWGGSLYVTARLRPGVSLRQANAALPTLAHRLRAADTMRYRDLMFRAGHANGISAELRPAANAASAFLVVVVALVLLIACANVANLLLARAADRRREFAVRIALGAPRRRLIRQLLTESALLAGVASVAAVLAAWWCADLIGRFTMSRSPEPILLSFTPDGRVLLATAALTALTTLLFGLLPAVRASALNVSPTLREESTQATGKSKTRSALVAAQVALCTVLLACSTLFLRSLANARVIDPGFATQGIVDAAIDLSSRQLDSARTQAFYSRLVERVSAIPGVQSATMAALVPLGGSNMQTGMWLPGAADAGDRASIFPYFNVVGRHYFRTLGIELLAGRDFGPEDAAFAGNVAIVNEQFVKRFIPSGSAIGARISVDGSRGPWLTIIGVARNTRYNLLGERTPEFLYLPFERYSRAEMVLHARASPDAEASVLRAIPGVVRELDPLLPPVTPASMADDMRIVLLPSQLAAGLLGSFGALALLLATAGIYAVASYTVAQRTRELGIRAALGATARDVLRLILGQSVRVAGLGLAIGLAAALAVARLLAAQLYGVSAIDPVTFLVMPAFLLAVVVFASFVPARRATRVAPSEALRAD